MPPKKRRMLGAGGHGIRKMPGSGGGGVRKMPGSGGHGIRRVMRLNRGKRKRQSMPAARKKVKRGRIMHRRSKSADRKYYKRLYPRGRSWGHGIVSRGYRNKKRIKKRGRKKINRGRYLLKNFKRRK